MFDSKDEKLSKTLAEFLKKSSITLTYPEVIDLYHCLVWYYELMKKIESNKMEVKKVIENTSDNELTEETQVSKKKK